MATRQEAVSRIGDVFAITAHRYFFRCAVCGSKIKKGEKVLKYLHNIGFATDHVHEKGCDEQYQKKYLITSEIVCPEALKQRALNRSLILRHSLADDRQGAFWF